MVPVDVEGLGRRAYVWGWALVNAAVRAARAKLVARNGPVLVQGAPIGHGTLAMQVDFIDPDQRVICCPSSSLLYGSGVFHLTGAPVVIRVPEFGNLFWMYALYDARTNAFPKAKVGMQYGTQPGYYLLVGPDWVDGSRVPHYILGVWKSPTDLAFVMPRVFPRGKDPATLLPILNQICSYPAHSFDPNHAPPAQWETLEDTDPCQLEAQREELEYAKPLGFIFRLRQVLANVDALPGEEGFYTDLNDTLDPLSHPLTWPFIRNQFLSGVDAAEADPVSKLMAWKKNGVMVGNGWYTPTNPAAWGPADYLERTAIAKSNMFENREEETKYFFTDTETSGMLLSGTRLYEITFPKGQWLKDHIDARAFWSLTVYDEFHMFNTVSNPNGRYSLGTVDEGNFDPDPQDGSLKLYAGPAPPSGKDKQWIPTPVGEPFSLYIRAYWPDDDVRTGKWIPPIVKRKA